MSCSGLHKCMLVLMKPAEVGSEFMILVGRKFILSENKMSEGFPMQVLREGALASAPPRSHSHSSGVSITSARTICGAVTGMYLRPACLASCLSHQSEVVPKLRQVVGVSVSHCRISTSRQTVAEILAKSTVAWERRRLRGVLFSGCRSLRELPS